MVFAVAPSKGESQKFNIHMWATCVFALFILKNSFFSMKGVMCS